MKASDIFVRALENEGIKHVFGIPGEENLDMLESLRESGIEMVVTRHEQAAGFMAATWGRLTGKIGVCMSTLGPGATNFTTAAAYAQLGGFPMMMVTGQKPIRKSKQGRFQIVDVVRMMEPLTKSAQQITEGSQIPRFVRDAVALAETERPGAVHFEFPEDVAKDEVSEGLVAVEDVAPMMVDAGALASALELVRAAKRPLLLIAAGGNRREDVAEACREFVEASGIYFVTSQMGKGVIDERHTRYLGTTALSGGDFMHCAVAAADLVIVVGHDLIEKPPFIGCEDGPKIVQMNYYKTERDWIYEPDVEVVGDLAGAIRGLSEVDRGGWDLGVFEKLHSYCMEEMAAGSDDERFPAIPQRIVADVRAAMPDDGIVCLDNGMYKLWFARHYKAYGRNTLLLDNALATMGAGLPSAMGATIACPGRKVLAVCGDGGFMMNSQELETAVRLKMDLVVMVLNDSGYQMIKWKQEDMGFGDYSLDFNNPDFVKYAESYGAKGWRVGGAGELSGLIERCFAEGGVHLIDMPIDYSVNKQLSGAALKAKGCPVC